MIKFFGKSHQIFRFFCSSPVLQDFGNLAKNRNPHPPK